MKKRFFLDTTVFIAAFWGDHVHHEASAPFLRVARREHACCAAHTVAEVYSILTRLPVKPAIAPEHAVLFVRQIRERFTVLALGQDEYFGSIERIAERGLAKNYIYDALITTAALKSGADLIYTWDLDDFERVAPEEVRKKIRTPSLPM